MMKFLLLALALVPSLAFGLAPHGADTVAARANHQRLARAVPITPEARRAREAPSAQKKRSNSPNKKRCKPKASNPIATGTATPTMDPPAPASASAAPSSDAGSETAPAGVQNDPTGAASVAPSASDPPTTFTSSPEPAPPSSTFIAPAPTSVAPPPTSIAPPPTSTPPPPPTTTSAAPPPPATSSAAPSDPNDPLGILSPIQKSGDGTFYATGLGSCGVTNSDTDMICAVSEDLYDNYPGYTGGNPNNNPVCGRQIIATYQGKSITVTVEDRCTGCAMDSLDFSPTAFSQLADQSVGRIHDMTWVWA